MEVIAPSLYWYIDFSLQNYYRDHLLRNEIGKVLSVCLDGNNTSAIVKVKVKAATGNESDVYNIYPD